MDKKSKGKNFFLEITCLNIHPSKLEFFDNKRNEINSKYKRIFPNIYSYQKEELNTLINDSPDDELDISKSVFRWLIRDLVKNTRFLFKSIISTYRFELQVLDSSQLPLCVQNQNGQNIWITRSAFVHGITPSDIEATLEEHRLKNPYQFQALLRKVSNQQFQYSPLEETAYSLGKIAEKDPKNTSFHLELKEYENAQVLHSKIVVVKQTVIPMSNRRSVLIPRKPAYINEQSNSYKVFKLFKGTRSIQKGIYVGTTTNWYHFIVELASRITVISENKRRDIPIIVGTDVHRNIVRLCELLTGVSPIQVQIGEALTVSHLMIVQEYGVKDPIDPLQRRQNLIDFRNQILRRLGPVEVPNISRIFLRRSLNLYRPLQNEEQIAAILHNSGFVSIYPEQWNLDEFITIIQNSKYIVAESGAAITNLMFAKPETKLLELQPALALVDFWQNFASIFELDYSRIRGKRSRFGRRGYASDGFTISAAELRNKVGQW